MGQAVDRFNDSRAAVLLSFLVPPLVLVFITIGLYRITHISQWPDFLGLYILGFVFGAIKYAVFYWLIWIYVKGKDGATHYAKFMVMNNWLAIPLLVSYLPAFVIWRLPFADGEQTLTWIMCGTGYAYLVLMFMTAKVFNVSQGNAGFTTWASMMVNAVGMLVFGKTGGMFVL